MEGDGKQPLIYNFVASFQSCFDSLGSPTMRTTKWLSIWKVFLPAIQNNHCRLRVVSTWRSMFKVLSSDIYFLKRQWHNLNPTVFSRSLVSENVSQTLCFVDLKHFAQNILRSTSFCTKHFDCTKHLRCSKKLLPSPIIFHNQTDNKNIDEPW